MDDVDRAFLPAYILTILWFVLIFIVTVPMRLSTLYIVNYNLFLAQIGLLVLFWILALLTPRYRHYHRSFKEWAKTYKYEKEAEA